MKKLLTVIILITAIAIQSCRKGEDDPALSLKSRENRITGNWKLVSLTGTNKITRDDGEEMLETYLLDKNISNQMTRYYFYLDQDVRYVYYFESFDIYLKMNKDETCECAYQAKSDRNYNWNIKNDWYWVNKGKSKEYINIQALDYIYRFKTEYRIQRLAEKELVLILEFSDTYRDDNNCLCSIDGYHTFVFEKTEK